MALYSNRFLGRSAIVTGGASGLGLEVACRIVAEGGRVAIWDINAGALADAYREVAASLECAYLDAGAVASPSPVDGVHLDAGAHGALGDAIAEVVPGLLG